MNFTDGSFDVLYGLDQSAVELRQLTVASGYRGSIGTSSAPLKIDTDPGSGSGSESLELAGSGYYYNFEGIYPIVTVTKNLATLKEYINYFMDLDLEITLRPHQISVP